jgi:hypothetical protein
MVSELYSSGVLISSSTEQDVKKVDNKTAVISNNFFIVIGLI